MGITANPFGVGASGQDFEYRTPTCECCGLRFSYQAHRRDPAPRRRWCDDCRGHAPEDGEVPERELERLRAHEPGLRARMEGARAAATRAESLISDAKAQTAAALQSRDRVQNMLAAVVDVHTEARDNRCSCGAAYPCVTIRAMRDQDPRLTSRLVQDEQARMLQEARSESERVDEDGD